MLAAIFVFVSLQILVSVSRSYQECYVVEPPQHARIQYSPDYLSYQVICETGYILHGETIVYCLDNEWSSPPPKCIGSEDVCQRPSDPENGRVKCDESLSIGSRCRFECSDGYQIKGITERVCMPNLQWSGSSPTCIPLESTFCSLPPPLINGRVIGCTSNNLPRVQERCSFRCNEGYEIQGPAFVTCTSSGKLVDLRKQENYPKCIAKLSNYQNRDSARFENGNAQIPQATKNNQDGPCYNNNCQQQCRIEKGRAQCRCNAGYLLNQEDQRTCRINTESTLYKKNPCLFEKGGCAQYCSVTKDRKVFCSCGEGYAIGDDRKSCIKSTGRQFFNPCLENNGGCDHYCSLMTNGEVTCRCEAGYILSSNQKTCLRNGYQYAGRDSNVPIPRPGPGFPVSLPRPRPIPIPRPVPVDPCKIDNGGCQHKCDTAWGTTVKCSCRKGYTLDTDRKHCVDIDECKNEILNNCNHYCSNTEGGFVCYCKRGYTLIDGHACEGCEKDSYWSIEQRECVDCPTNSHTFGEGSTSIEECMCDSGFLGSPRDGIPCEDVDECSRDNYGCSDTCNNIPGSAYCSCPNGFMLDKDNKTCIDKDECSIKNGGCDGTCINEIGSFHCTCPDGYRASNKDQYSCDDVNECEDNNGGCQQKCHNYHGGYYCSCEDGYHLDSGQKNCTDIQCPAFSVPSYSKIVCKNGRRKLLEMDNYPSGTICGFECNAGFKKIGDFDTMECQKDGTWNGNQPKCIPQKCPYLEVPENGDVHPSFCSKRGHKVRQKCTFTCRTGYVMKGKPVFQCKNDLTWDVDEIPVCQAEKVRPGIECPADVIATLLPGKKTHNITLPEPKTNMEGFTVQPDGLVTGTPYEFQAGVTKVTFTAISSSSDKTTKCVTTVTVLDKEPPVFEYCPDPIQIEGAGSEGAFVTWNDPIVTDNVEVELLFSILEPNITLAPGTHVAEYMARDAAGNTASCSFDITIIRMNCSELSNPAHGEANCMDWMFGKLCQPLCDVGYARNPDDPPYYSCDDSGVWEPTDVISECLKFTPATSSSCPDGFELKINQETSEAICIACPSNTVWSEATKTCEEN